MGAGGGPEPSLIWTVAKAVLHVRVPSPPPEISCCISTRTRRAQGGMASLTISPARPRSHQATPRSQQSTLSSRNSRTPTRPPSTGSIDSPGVTINRAPLPAGLFDVEPQTTASSADYYNKKHQDYKYKRGIKVGTRGSSE